MLDTHKDPWWLSTDSPMGKTPPSTCRRWSHSPPVSSVTSASSILALLLTDIVCCLRLCGLLVFIPFSVQIGNGRLMRCAPTSLEIKVKTANCLEASQLDLLTKEVSLMASRKSALSNHYTWVSASWKTVSKSMQITITSAPGFRHSRESLLKTFLMCRCATCGWLRIPFAMLREIKSLQLLSPPTMVNWSLKDLTACLLAPTMQYSWKHYAPCSETQVRKWLNRTANMLRSGIE